MRSWGGCCGDVVGACSSLSLAAVDADGPGERLLWRQEPPPEELPPTLPAGTEHHDFSITSAGVDEEEGLGHGDGGGEGASVRGGGVRLDASPAHGLNSRGVAQAKGLSVCFNAA